MNNQNGREVMLWGKCECLLHFYFWIFCHNNFTRVQCAISRKVSFNHFFIANVWYVSHTPPYSFFMGVLAALFYWSLSLSPISYNSLKFSSQHVATFILSFSGLFIVHFHSVEDIFSCFWSLFPYFSNHIFITIFFLLNSNELLVNFIS